MTSGAEQLGRLLDRIDPLAQDLAAAHARIAGATTPEGFIAALDGLDLVLRDYRGLTADMRATVVATVVAGDGVGGAARRLAMSPSAIRKAVGRARGIR